MKMFNLSNNKVKNITILSVIITVMLMFPLINLVPSTSQLPTKLIHKEITLTNNGYVEFLSKGRVSASILATTFESNSIQTGMVNENNTNMGTQENNTIYENQDKNGSEFLSNLTDPINNISSGSSGSTEQRTSEISADFNGDGFEDKAIGVPGEDFGSIVDAGAVHVIYGSPGGLSATAVLSDQLWSQSLIGGTVEPSDHFGWSLSSGDYNNDGRDDLAIGVSGEALPGTNAGDEQQRIGIVHVIYGSQEGLSAEAILPVQVWMQGNENLEEIHESDDYFGSSLSSGDYNGDQHDDLAIGVPGEDLDSIVDAGAVQVIYGSAGGLSTTAVLPDQFWIQHLAYTQANTEADDGFGTSLSSGDYNGDGHDDLAIGVPGEGLNIGPSNSPVSCGLVIVIDGSAEGLVPTVVSGKGIFVQGIASIDEVAESNDRFGSSLSSGDYNGDQHYDLVIGVPGEDFGSIADAGAVHVIYGSPGGLSATAVLADQLWSLNSLGESVEALDYLGSSLSSGDYNNDGQYDLSIGVSHENIDSINSAGAVHVIYGSPGGLSATTVLAAQLWSQNVLGGGTEAFDYFGISLSSGDYNGDGHDDLAVGVLEDFGSIVNAGAVHVIYGSPGGLSVTAVLANQFLKQGLNELDDLAEANDFFGWSL